MLLPFCARFCFGCLRWLGCAQAARQPRATVLGLWLKQDLIHCTPQSAAETCGSPRQLGLKKRPMQCNFIYVLLPWPALHSALAIGCRYQKMSSRLRARPLAAFMVSILFFLLLFFTWTPTRPTTRLLCSILTALSSPFVLARQQKMCPNLVRATVVSILFGTTVSTSARCEPPPSPDGTALSRPC